MNFDPNPLFYEMVALYNDNRCKEDKVIICNEGGSRCFAKGTKIVSNSGLINIEEVEKDTLLLTHNEQTREKEYKKVAELIRSKNTKPSYRIMLKNGSTIEATQDHEFFFEGSWHDLKHIVSLWHESKNIN